MSGSGSKYLDTRGQPTLGIGVCDRCQTKRPLAFLVKDPNAPGLRVCRDKSEGCKDDYDPYRLPMRQPDRVQLPFNRPDTPLSEPPQFTDYLKDG